MLHLDIFSVGYHDGRLAGYGAMLIASASDGRQKSYEVADKLGKYTKNQADLISVIMGLRCIKEDFRSLDVVLHTPPGYAGQMLERIMGEWATVPQANIDIVTEARGSIELFPNITIEKVAGNEPHLRRCIKIAKQAIVDL